MKNRQTKSEEYETDSPVPSNPMEPSTSGYDEKCPDGANTIHGKREPYWQKFPRRWIIVLSTVGLAIYTGMLYHLTTQQAKNSSISAANSYALSKKVADTQEQFAKIETRAYIVFEDTIFGRKPMDFRVKYSNVGKTPSFKTVAGFQWIVDTAMPSDWMINRLSSKETFKDLTKSLRDEWTFTLGAGLTSTVIHDYTNRKLTIEDSIAVSRGYKALAVAVKILYVDGFNDEHSTEGVLLYQSKLHPPRFIFTTTRSD